MSTLERFRKHERLMSRMADANGIDLDLKMQSGELTPASYEDAVLNCTGCSDPEGCQKHLGEGRSGFPTFCRNRDALLRLAGSTPSLD